MDKIKKLNYRKPELVDFKWAGVFGVCFANGSADVDTCESHGNNAVGAYGCSANGYNASGGPYDCLANGEAAVGNCYYAGNAVT